MILLKSVILCWLILVLAASECLACHFLMTRSGFIENTRQIQTPDHTKHCLNHDSQLPTRPDHVSHVVGMIKVQGSRLRGTWPFSLKVPKLLSTIVGTGIQTAHIRGHHNDMSHLLPRCPNLQPVATLYRPRATRTGTIRPVPVLSLSLAFFTAGLTPSVAVKLPLPSP